MRLQMWMNEADKSRGSISISHFVLVAILNVQLLKGGKAEKLVALQCLQILEPPYVKTGTSGKDEWEVKKLH
ncbi:hypothetical protein Ahy_A06g028377 isoform B [Arachis hypogaea]|uniref:Uncharacterized protein n=1 Tax=Arachis hypogaea TaxID=3818 RepID=A0A445CQX0_ARAHY|nr:hypothetical protein Ahy_A06g028377 isoform B [Arachis hypogaea]